MRLLTERESVDARNLLYVLNKQVFQFNDLDYVYFAEDSPQISYSTFTLLPDL